MDGDCDGGDKEEMAWKVWLGLGGQMESLK